MIKKRKLKVVKKINQLLEFGEDDNFMSVVEEWKLKMVKKTLC